MDTRTVLTQPLKEKEAAIAYRAAFFKNILYLKKPVVKKKKTFVKRNW